MSVSQQGSVTARLKGGLGNQLFQYAAGKALAQQLNTPFYIDTAFYLKPHSNRKFKLPEVGIDVGTEVGVDSGTSVQTNNFSKVQRITNKLKAQVLPISLNGARLYLKEPPDYGYHDFNCNASQHVYLDGYWQSEKYFKDIRQELLAEIDLSNISFSDETIALPSESTVAVHVRRGDFISQNSSQALTTDYVERAMREFGNNEDFMFFSDDIAWCKEHFKGDNIAFANNQTDLQDLKQMSLAAHNIIANSTFSWWSAWLNQSPSQRVIAPQPWTNENTHRDILPPSWQVIKA